MMQYVADQRLERADLPILALSCPVRGHLTPQPGYGAGLPAAHAVAVVLVIYR
jgi:hypothetical protein